MRTATKAVLLASALLLPAAPPTHANHDYYHHGSCSYDTTSDGTDSPATRWDGKVYATVVAADKRTWAPTGERLTVECILRITGQPATVVLAESGDGVVAKVADLTYYADPDDLVVVCTQVTTDSDVIGHCNEAVGRPLLPPAIDEPVRAAIDEALTIADSAVCLGLRALDGSAADQPPAFDIRTDGDLYVAGEWIWDCPPYRTSGT